MSVKCQEVVKDDRGQPIKISIPNGPKHLPVECQKDKGHKGPHLFKYGGFYTPNYPPVSSVHIMWMEGEEDDEEAMRRFR